MQPLRQVHVTDFFYGLNYMPLVCIRSIGTCIWSSLSYMAPKHILWTAQTRGCIYHKLLNVYENTSRSASSNNLSPYCTAVCRAWSRDTTWSLWCIKWHLRSFSPVTISPYAHPCTYNRRCKILPALNKTYEKKKKTFLQVADIKVSELNEGRLS